MLTPDECAGELYDIVFWVHSYFKSTFIEENEGMDGDQLIQIIKDRNYEMLLLTLWVMHTYLPSEKLRGKVYERFFKAVIMVRVTLAGFYHWIHFKKILGLDLKHTHVLMISYGFTPVLVLMSLVV